MNDKEWQQIRDEEWDDFLDWLYKAHQVTRDYVPNRPSCELWEEYKRRRNEI